MRPSMMRSILVVFALVGASGCNTVPQSTRLRGSDFDVTVAEMAANLSGSDFLRERGPESPPIAIVIQRVENLTSDVIPPAEQWMLMARVRAAMPITELAYSKNVRFQITPERHALLRQAGYDGDWGRPEPPTHLMSATFRSSPRLDSSAEQGHVKRRQEYYYLEYQIIDLESRQLQWSHSFEFKREAAGLLID